MSYLKYLVYVMQVVKSGDLMISVNLKYMDYSPAWSCQHFGVFMYSIQ